MSKQFVPCDRNQRLLLPPDLRDWIPADDMVHFVIHAVEQVDMSHFKVSMRGRGSAQYHPRMMLALLVYCYANGVFSSRRIERATYQNVAVRYLCADTHPDHDTIATFRRMNFDAVSECFVRVLELARELNLLKVGTVSVDGTTIKASASKNRNVRYDRAGELIEQLKGEVRELLGKAERADHADVDKAGSLPQELAHRQALQAKLEAARRRIEDRAKKKAEASQAEYERKVRERDARSGSSKGKRIPAPDATPRPKEQENLTDTDSRLMRHNKRSAYEQAYNVQAVVDADGSQLVVGARVSQCASDRNELVADVRSIPARVGTPGEVLADNGYLCEAQVRELEGKGEQPAMNVLVSAHAEAKQLRRKHDFRPASPEGKLAPEVRSEFVKEMIGKMERPENRARYKLRKQTVEPVFGIVKKWIGFTQFFLRGLAKVSGEWSLVTLAYNVKRLWRLRNPKARETDMWAQTAACVT